MRAASAGTRSILLKIFVRTVTPGATGPTRDAARTFGAKCRVDPDRSDLRRGAGVLARALDAVHRGVGGPEQILAVSAIGRKARDPDRGGDLDVLALVSLIARRAQRRTQGLRPLPGRFPILSGQQGAELVAAEARGAIAGAELAPQARADLGQHATADQMAVRVHHALEVVDVEEHHRERLPAAHLVIQLLQESGRVEQLAERVTACELEHV